jgi:serine/threonine-protein kinase HipA
MSLGVYWDAQEVGRLERVDERSREYAFSYTQGSRAISLSLPLSQERFSPAQSRPFFEALLPEGAVRDQIASQLRLAASDSFGLLAELGRDCAGALQIVDTKRMPDPPSVRWLDESELDALVQELPRHPLGMQAEDDHLRLSLAGVQHKAVLVRDEQGRFGKPLDGMPSSHILKPQLPDSKYPGLATNEYFCMRLAARCGLSTAGVELIAVAGRPCLVVERFDRQQSTWPPRRVHQEDFCQALGLTPDFKYQKEGWQLPSYRALADLLDEHGPWPGLDRLAGAQAAVFHYLVGNADAHAKNISLVHTHDGVRLAPLYDVLCTAAYPDLSKDLALSIGDELDPDAVTSIHWSDLANDFSLNIGGFERVRRELLDRVVVEAPRLRDEARAEDWYQPSIDSILAVIAARGARVV